MFNGAEKKSELSQDGKTLIVFRNEMSIGDLKVGNSLQYGEKSLIIGSIAPAKVGEISDVKEILSENYGDAITRKKLLLNKHSVGVANVKEIKKPELAYA